MTIHEALVNFYSNKSQILKAAEECGELIQALCKYLISIDPEFGDQNLNSAVCRRHVLAEAVQVEIMIKQLRHIFDNPKEWARVERFEVARLCKRLREEGWVGFIDQ